MNSPDDPAAEKVTPRRVQEGLFHLRRGLTPFVEARMRKAHGERWQQHASRAQGSPSLAALDEYGLLKTMIDSWREAFDEAFGRAEKHKVRSFTSLALEARNATAHLSLALQDDEALRYLDAMHQLLKLVKADPVEAAELRKLYEEQRRSGFAPPATPAAPPVDTQPAQPKLGLETAERPARALRPWIEVALPHPDVLANRFKESEFAADLFAVDSGHATEDYAAPASFFRITYLTEGLKRVLTSALQRLAKVGGDPVIGLQTAFGGGKTHTLLSVYHLAKASDLGLLAAATSDDLHPLTHAQPCLQGAAAPRPDACPKPRRVGPVDVVHILSTVRWRSGSARPWLGRRAIRR